MNQPPARESNFLDLAELTRRIARSPCNSWLGLQPIAIDGAGVSLKCEARPEMIGNPEVGALHGGIIAGLIDVACAFAWLVRDGGLVSTIDLRTDFHRPARAGTLFIRGDVVKAGRTIITADARITDADARLIASGRAVMTPNRATPRLATNQP